MDSHEDLCSSGVEICDGERLLFCQSLGVVASSSGSDWVSSFCGVSSTSLALTSSSRSGFNSEGTGVRGELSLPVLSLSGMP